MYTLRESRRPRNAAALLLALETTCLGLFVALDLIVFFVFFDLSIVGMYFVIVGWGHGAQKARSALKFFLYTFVGSARCSSSGSTSRPNRTPSTWWSSPGRPPRRRRAAGALVLLALQGWGWR